METFGRFDVGVSLFLGPGAPFVFVLVDVLEPNLEESIVPLSHPLTGWDY